MKSHLSLIVPNTWTILLLSFTVLLNNCDLTLAQFVGFPYGFIPGPPKLGFGPTQIQKEVYQALVFEYGSVAPDNYVQDGILINGQFPGPPIRVHMYDVLVIDVTNKLDHGIALHFHGIRNYGQPEADGVPYVTQELIPAGGSFRYVVNIGFQTGTFIYHLHTGLDSIWAVGPLIIEDGSELLANQPSYYHFWDYTFILSQCWHTNISEMLKGLEGSPHKDLPEPESILINGRSYGKWEELNGLTDGYEVINVKKGLTYRFRVIGFGADSILTFKIAGHTMKVIEVDGIITKPIKVDRLEVNSGQRYSVLVEMNQTEGNYFIESEMIPGPGPRNGKAILHYEGAPEPSPTMKKEYFPGKTEKVNLTQWEKCDFAPNPKIRQPDIYLPPMTVDKEILIKTHQKKDSNDKVKFEVNGNFYKDPDTPWLFQVRKGINITKEPQVFQSVTNKSIQIIFQNVANEDGKCEQHPWHIHGHSFYIVGHGPGEYDKSSDGKNINDHVKNNSKNLVFRDVVTLYPSVDKDDEKDNEEDEDDDDDDKDDYGTPPPSKNANVTMFFITKKKAPSTSTATDSPSDLLKASTDSSSNLKSAAFYMEPEDPPTTTSSPTITSTTTIKTTKTPAIAAVTKKPSQDLDKLKDGTPCGWVAIRFVTDNPGVWLVHCHLTAHLIMGKEFIIYSYQETNPMLTPVG